MSATARDAAPMEPGAGGAVSAGSEIGFIRFFTAFRAAWALLGAVTFVTRRARFRRPRVAALAVLVSAIDVGWIARRTVKGRPAAPSEIAIDDVVGLGALVATALSVGSADQVGPLTDWVFNLGLWNSAATAAAAPSFTTGALAGVAVSAVYAAVVGRRVDADERGAVLANAVQFVFFYGASFAMISGVRRGEQAIAVAREAAVAAAEQAARETERVRLTSEVHQTVLSSLEEIAARWGHDRVGARRVARAEALRLRQLLGARAPSVTDFTGSLTDAAIRFARQGIAVELICDIATEPPAARCDAALRAVVAAVAVLADGVDEPRCTVRVVTSDAGVAATIRQHVVAFETEVPMGRVHDALDPVGGSAHVQLLPGRGARVTLRVPA